MNSNEMQTTMQQVRTIAAGVLSLQENCICDQAKLREELGADSLDLVAMITICAQTFAVKVCEEGVHEISTISDIATYIVLNKTRERQRNGESSTTTSPTGL